MIEFTFFSVQQVIDIHDAALKFDGAPGIRDLNALESAVEMPRMQIFGGYIHPTLCEMAAAYLYHIVMNHPFLDGNKRTGAATAKLFLKLNNHNVDFSNDAFEELVVEVAKGNVSKSRIAYFFESHSYTF